MKFNRLLSALMIGTVLLLGACANREDQTTGAENPAASASPAEDSSVEASPAPSETTADHSAPQQGGQVVETGAYHLELVAVPEASGTHLDLFLQTGDNHEPVEGATVKAQVQLPNGAQEEIDLGYDEEGKHYAALLPATDSGKYEVVILTDINGEKVNGRFIFIK